MNPRLWAWPWLDRKRRVSALRVTTLALLLAPVLALGWWAARHQLGARPWTEAIHETGLWAIRFLFVSLAITPARIVADQPRVVPLRRMIGVAAMAYALLHLGLYVADQNFHLLHVASEIARRFYLTIGFVAVAGLVVLGITSTDGWIRRLGRDWKRLHRVIYPVAVLAGLHYFLQSKADVTEPAIMAGLLLWLFAWRLLPSAWRGRPRGLLALVPATLIGTALLEAAWYGLATRVPYERILAANWHPRFWPRPAMWAAAAALAAFILFCAVRLGRGKSKKGALS